MQALFIILMGCVEVLIILRYLIFKRAKLLICLSEIDQVNCLREIDNNRITFLKSFISLYIET